MTTFAQALASFTSEISLDIIPVEVARAMERYLADTLACAVAAMGEPDAPVIEMVLAQADLDRARPEASVIGAGWKTSARSAALVNSTLARYLDANDIYMPPAGSLSGSGHFSDAIPGVLAAAERVGATGAETLEALVACYEIQAALADSMPWLDRGFHSVSQVTVAVPLAGGRLLGLDPNELANAAALATTTGMFVQSWLRPGTGVSGLKGASPGLAAERGLLCAELAGRGFSAPLDALETLFEHFAGERASKLGRARLGREWTVLRNAIKAVPAQIFTQPIVQCAEQLYAHGLRLSELESLTVRSNEGACGRVQGSPGAFAPESREAADHSTPFVVAMTLRDGALTLDSYADLAWLDAGIRAAMARMELIIEPGWEQCRVAGLLGGEVEARDRSGRSYYAKVEQFRGHPDNPLSESELVAKLDRFTGRGEALLAGCRALMSESSVESLLALLVPRGVDLTG